MFQSCIQMSQSYLWMSESCFKFLDLFLFLFIILARNIDFLVLGKQKLKISASQPDLFDN